jgi:hypothetical protein
VPWIKGACNADTLTGTIRAVTTLGGGVNKKTGEVIPTRPVLQIEGLDNRGLV